MYSCKLCKRVISDIKAFSRNQLNKLSHKEITNSDLKCRNCVTLESGNRNKFGFVESTVSNKTPIIPKSKLVDPSAIYIKSPAKAPVVKKCVDFFKQLGRTIKVFVGNVNGWRTSAKLAVRNSVSVPNECGNSVNRIEIGLFIPGTHAILDCTTSLAHHPSINKAASILSTACNHSDISAYDEKTGEGLLKYVLFGVERSTSTVQLTLVLNAEFRQMNQSSVSSLIQTLHGLELPFVDCRDTSFTTKSTYSILSKDSIFHSVWVHYHKASKHVNSITGRDPDSWEIVFGKEHVQEVLNVGMYEDRLSKGNSSTSTPEDSRPKKRLREEQLGVSVEDGSSSNSSKPSLRFPPMVFRQANLEGFSSIIREIRKWIVFEPACIELYGGVGTIGLNCLDLLRSLNCSDENPFNKACFDATLSELPDILRGRAAYRSAPASQVATETGFQSCQLVIVDPPRKGLDAEVLAELLKPLRVTPPAPQEGERGGSKRKKRPAPGVRQRLIYVSCGFPAFERDAKALLGIDGLKDAGSPQWHLLHAEGHVLFPGADHVETLAVFERL